MRARRICPAYADGVCRRDYAEEGAGYCRTFECSQCGQLVPWCFGGSEDERCDACYAFSCSAQHDARAYVS